MTNPAQSIEDYDGDSESSLLLNVELDNENPIQETTIDVTGETLMDGKPLGPPTASVTPYSYQLEMFEERASNATSLSQ